MAGVSVCPDLRVPQPGGGVPGLGLFRRRLFQRTRGLALRGGVHRREHRVRHAPVGQLAAARRDGEPHVSTPETDRRPPRCGHRREPRISPGHRLLAPRRHRAVAGGHESAVGRHDAEGRLEPDGLRSCVDCDTAMTRKTAAPRPRAPRVSLRHGVRRRPHDATLARLRGERDLALDRARREAEFISHASHEIRTPLHGIMGFSTLLLSTELTDEQRSFANALHTSIESLLAVVNDVLDVSTLDAGAMRLESVRFNLLTLVRGVVDTFAQAATTKGLALRVDTTAVKHPHLIGDPGRVRQIVVNLVSNAVKFTEAGEVTVQAVTQAHGRGGVEVHVSVTDTGRGIPRHAQAYLFQPFSRLHQPGLAPAPGTGLGLSILKQLVELMGGAVTVKSSPGRGSTFQVAINLLENVLPGTLRDLEPGTAGRLRVYVADDDARSLSELLLSLAAVGVSVAGSGSATGLPEALRTSRASGHPLDVAIVGHVRHQGGDLAIAQAVKADPRLTGLPLVLAPVSGIRGYARDVREAGYSAYVPRPFQGDELLKCLRAAVTQGQEGPVDDTRLITRHNVSDDPTSAGAGRVLVADDDPASRQVVRLQIARLGYLVDDVSGGRDAVAAAATGNYQLILMDCQMPDMDGLSATAAIRRHEPPGHHTHIVALTADVSADQRARCRKAGMDEFLEKPLRTQTLAGLLNRRLRRGHDALALEPPVDVVGRTQSPTSGIDMLEAEIGSEMTRELVREYLAGVEQTITRLTQADGVDAADVRSTAHRLLGGARVLGLARFERIWAPLSERRDGAEDGIPPAVIDDLRAAAAELRAWFDSCQR